MSSKLKTEATPLHLVLREILRHYTEFKAHVTSTGDHVLEHSYLVYNQDGSVKSKETVVVSFWDLHRGIKELSPRKREALFYNVILDWKQKDVADQMGITTVSVGQYVLSATQQLSQRYFNSGDNTKPINNEKQECTEDIMKLI